MEATNIHMTKLRIILADDHIMVRAGLKMLVNSEPDMEIVGEANNGHVAIRLAQELKPDIVVMDISMPELNGIEATKILKRLCPDVKVLALTRLTDDSYLQQLLQAGASGFALKQSAADELVRAIRHIVSGKTYLDPEMTEHVIDAAMGRRTATGRTLEKNLSKRELEVLRYTAFGYANKEIAALLRISVRTVEVHKAHAMRKMGMKSRIEIVRYAILKGWLQDR
jgi:DNA-binding NarL/FixJ family response regulator